MSTSSSASPAAPLQRPNTSIAAEQARNTVNQRRLRERRKEYIHELETKVRNFERQGIQATQIMQQAARVVLDQNRDLEAKVRMLELGQQHLPEQEQSMQAEAVHVIVEENKRLWQMLTNMGVNEMQVREYLQVQTSTTTASVQRQQEVEPELQVLAPQQQQQQRQVFVNRVAPALAPRSVTRRLGIARVASKEEVRPRTPPVLCAPQQPLPAPCHTPICQYQSLKHLDQLANPSLFEMLPLANSALEAEIQQGAGLAEQQVPPSTMNISKPWEDAIDPALGCLRNSLESSPRVEHKRKTCAHDEMDCVAAAQIITSMRGGLDPEEIWPELGCSRTVRTSVKNSDLMSLI